MSEFESHRTSSDPLELAWMAGFFDGEGYVGIAKTTVKQRGRVYRGHGLHVVVSQTSPGPLGRFRERFGGRLRQVREARGNSSACWTWEATMRDAAVFLVAVRPYLRHKRGQADIAIAFQERRGERGQCLSPAARSADVRDYHLLRALKRKVAQLEIATLDDEEPLGQLTLEAA